MSEENRLMNQVKFGIIGIGNMGAVHEHNVSQLPNCRLTAVCDINLNAFQRIRDEKIRGSLAFFTDSETFFKPHENHTGTIRKNRKIFSASTRKCKHE